MSIGEKWARRMAEANLALAEAERAKPPAFNGETCNGTPVQLADIGPDGSIFLSRDSFTADQALALAKWIIDTLGEPLDEAARQHESRHRDPRECAEIEAERDGLLLFKASVDEALNSGDGSYRP